MGILVSDIAVSAVTDIAVSDIRAHGLKCHGAGATTRVLRLCTIPQHDGALLLVAQGVAPSTSTKRLLLLRINVLVGQDLFSACAVEMISMSSPAKAWPDSWRSHSLPLASKATDIHAALLVECNSTIVRSALRLRANVNHTSHYPATPRPTARLPVLTQRANQKFRRSR